MNSTEPLPPIQVGEWVVLKAKPPLTAPELIAIFEVLEIEDALVQVQADGLGKRRYPVDWVLPYPKRPAPVTHSERSEDRRRAP
jgi:hypothetical protein